MATEAERTQIAVLQNDMHQVKSDIADIKIRQTEGFASIEKKLEAQDKKYASKWVQQVVGGLIAIVLIAVITALLALVIIPAAKKQTPQAISPESHSSSSSITPAGSPAITSSSTTPSATASATSHSDTATPDSNQTSQSNPEGGVSLTLPKVP